MAQESKYTPELGAFICAGMADGRSMLQVCKEAGVAYSTAYQWEIDIPEHAANSTRAREIGCHTLAHQCLDIADDSRRDWTPVKDAEGAIIGVRVDGEHVQRSKLMIETRMRLIGKWLAKVYGDKVAIGGAEDLPPIRSISDEQLLQRIAALKAKVGA